MASPLSRSPLAGAGASVVQSPLSDPRIDALYRQIMSNSPLVSTIVLDDSNKELVGKLTEEYPNIVERIRGVIKGLSQGVVDYLTPIISKIEEIQRARSVSLRGSPASPFAGDALDAIFALTSALNSDARRQLVSYLEKIEKSEKGPK